MRKRSKYRPRNVLLNPVGFVLEGMTPVRAHDSYLLDLKIRNHDAMAKLLRAEATQADMDTLIACSNITEALYKLGFGEEYGEVCIGGREAIIGIAHRAVEHKRYVPTGPEINKLNLMMELHDAQMDVITIKDMERALAYAKNQFKTKKGVTYLPSVKELK
jgi:tRNA(Leu) C34 or U34 (ribose-2'-O)-methylase TrmL